MEGNAEETIMTKVCRILIPLLIAMISATLVTTIVSSPKLQEPSLSYLEDSQKQVMKLAGAAVGASTAITVMPGDTATPVAQKLADLSGYFVIILAALYLEKYLFMVMANIGFRFLIPIACVLFAVGQVKWKHALRSAATKLLVLTLSLYLAVPCSTYIAGMVMTESEASIDETIEQAQKASGELKATAEKSRDSDGTLIEKVFNAVSGGVSKVTHEFEDILSSFLNSIAVLLITSCAIPIIVLVVLVLILKSMFNIPVSIPALPYRQGKEGED